MKKCHAVGLLFTIFIKARAISAPRATESTSHDFPHALPAVETSKKQTLRQGCSDRRSTGILLIARFGGCWFDEAPQIRFGGLDLFTRSRDRRLHDVRNASTGACAGDAGRHARRARPASRQRQRLPRLSHAVQDGSEWARARHDAGALRTSGQREVAAATQGHAGLAVGRIGDEYGVLGPVGDLCTR